MQGIFARFVQLRSTTTLVRELTARAITTRKGSRFSKQGIQKLLTNRVYRGEITHKNECFAGQHEAIIDQALWDAVQAVFAEHKVVRRSATFAGANDEALLRGLIFLADGERLQPSFTTNRLGRRYRYYVSRASLRFGADANPLGMLPAEPIEKMVLAQVHEALGAPECVQAVWTAVQAADRQVSEPEVVLALRNLAGV